MILDHVQLAIPPGSEDAQRPFWIELLGFEEVEKPDPLRDRGGVWLRQGVTEVHLGVEADHHPARKAHPAFRTAIIDVLAERLMAAGFPPEWDTSIDGLHRFFVFDPAGNRIEILEAL